MKRFVTLYALVLSAFVASVAHAVPAPRTLSEMIKAGRYDSVSEGFTDQNFPVKSESFTTEGLEVISLKGPMGTGVMIGIMYDHGLRPATLEELLAYGAAYPAAQRKTKLVALGSTSTTEEHYAQFPVLAGSRRERHLILQTILPNQPWADVSFLAARDPSIWKPSTLAEMIEAGHYGQVDPIFVEKNFPVKPERFTTRSLAVFQIKKRMTTKGVLAEIERQDLRPATIEELLAYGAEYPAEQQTEIIVALGTTWRAPGGNRRVAVLGGDVGMRGLHRAWAGPGDWWRANNRFLVAPK